MILLAAIGTVLRRRGPKKGATLAAAVLLASCQTGSGLVFSTATPPLALVPADEAGVSD
jgi:hypothetical protein